MIQWKLGPRLSAVASFIREGDRIADVGTDHAMLPVWLLENGKVSHAIASDIHEGPLRAARVTAAKSETEHIEFRLCGGLSGIESREADTVIIAGMSGETMQTILEEADWDWSGKCLILQPMTHQKEILEWLYHHGFHVDGECFAEEHGSIYRIFSVVAGSESMPRLAYLWGGFTDGAYAQRIAARLNRAAEGIKAANQVNESHLNEITAILEDMRDAYGW